METYVAQILHDVEKVVCLLAGIAHLVDGLSQDEVLGDLGPHVLVLLPRLYVELPYRTIVSSCSRQSYAATAGERNSAHHFHG
jgi:hypothetical protein